MNQGYICNSFVCWTLIRRQLRLWEDSCCVALWALFIQWECLPQMLQLLFPRRSMVHVQSLLLSGLSLLFFLLPPCLHVQLRVSFLCFVATFSSRNTSCSSSLLSYSSSSCFLSFTPFLLHVPLSVFFYSLLPPLLFFPLSFYCFLPATWCMAHDVPLMCLTEMLGEIFPVPPRWWSMA